MEKAIQYFLAADTIAMSPFKWGMTVSFTAFLLFLLYIIWKRGLRDIDIISLLLILIVLLRSCYPLFINDESLDQTLRLLFFLFPLSTALLSHYLFTELSNNRIEQLVIGLVAVLLAIVNLAFGGALNPGSAHWWADIYPLKLVNQVWLLAAMVYSILVVLRLFKDKKPYSGFTKLVNIGLVIYLFGHFLLSLNTTMAMYWKYRYLGFVSELILVFAFGYLLWHLFQARDGKPVIRNGVALELDIFDVIDKVPSDKLIHYLTINHSGSIPEKVLDLTPRQQLQAILMIHKVSIKDSAEYSFITPEAVKVYRSRIRRKLV